MISSSAANGIFLHSEIEKAFDRGFLTIVRDIDASIIWLTTTTIQHPSVLRLWRALTGAA